MMQEAWPDSGFIGRRAVDAPQSAGGWGVGARGWLVGLVVGIWIFVGGGGGAFGQQTLELTGGGWSEAGEQRRSTDPLDPEDRAVLDRARTLLAEDRPRAALGVIRAWIEDREFSEHPGLAEALLIRGDALTAVGGEFKALYDYERILREFPGSESFITANEREYAIAERYLTDLKMRFLGMRILDASDIAVELLIRIQERMPGSALAERSAIRLADFYYDRREIALASDMYDIYLRNFPNGENRIKAEKRRIYTDLARFKGPRYDASSLTDARLNIEDFARRYPLEAQRTGLNDGLLARIDESQAAQMLDTAEWYLQTKNYPAARLTMERLIIAHPLTFASERARAFMADRGWAVPGGVGDDVGGEGDADEGGVILTGPQRAEVVGGVGDDGEEREAGGAGDGDGGQERRR
ncbi:MAG: outer membrane protein assembly factor BamD [Phycisphaerales bacterium]